MPDEPTPSEAPQEPADHGRTRLFRIHEEDLVDLERILPDLCMALYDVIDNRLRVQLRRVKDIVSNVRWEYGPPLQVISIPCGEDEDDEEEQGEGAAPPPGSPSPST